MIEDVLEQLVEDYYSRRPGCFTKHNVKFRPSKSDPLYNSQMDSVHSDIDVIAISTSSPGVIKAVSCKSWQGGFNITAFMKGIEDAIVRQPTKTKGKTDIWCTFRELCIRKWTTAFVEELRKETGLSQKSPLLIDYSIVCTRITPGSLGDKERFENSPIIRKHFKESANADITLNVLAVPDLIKELIANLKDKSTPSVEMTELSRTLQILLASGCSIEWPQYDVQSGDSAGNDDQLIARKKHDA